MIEDMDDIQYKVLKILTATINYGGRVTDKIDARFISTFVERFINEDLMD